MVRDRMRRWRQIRLKELQKIRQEKIIEKMINRRKRINNPRWIKEKLNTKIAKT